MCVCVCVYMNNRWWFVIQIIALNAVKSVKVTVAMCGFLGPFNLYVLTNARLLKFSSYAYTKCNYKKQCTCVCARVCVCMCVPRARACVCVCLCTCRNICKEIISSSTFYQERYSSKVCISFEMQMELRLWDSNSKRKWIEVIIDKIRK